MVKGDDDRNSPGTRKHLYIPRGNSDLTAHQSGRNQPGSNVRDVRFGGISYGGGPRETSTGLENNVGDFHSKGPSECSSVFSSEDWDSITSMSVDMSESGTSSSHGETSPRRDINYQIMPTNDVVLREFEEYLEALSPISEDDENGFRMKSIEEKWRLVFDEEKKEPQHTPKAYIDNLQKHTGTIRKRQTSIKTAKDGPQSLSHWLRKLKHDLRLSTESFVNEFASKSLGGISVLVNILKDIQKDQEKLQSVRKSKADLIKQTMLEEYDCLLCLKFALKKAENVQILLDCTGSVDLITMCLMSTFRKTTLTVIEILTLVCETHSGFQQVVDAITMLRVKNMESVRFKLIASMLHSQTINRHFQAACVRFFNKLMTTTNNANDRVFLQCELQQAGFEPDLLDKYSLQQTEDLDELQNELEIWRKNVINIENTYQELFELKNRNSYLRDEIDRLQSKLKDVESENSRMEKEKTSATYRRDQLREKNAEFQDMLGRVIDLYKTRVGEDPADEIEELNNYHQPLDTYATVRDKFNTVNSANSRLLGSIGPETKVPSAPPLIPFDFLSKTIRRKVEADTNVNLPTISWTPIHSTKNTLFEDIDDEAKLREIDFSEFDKTFQIPAKEIEARQRGEKIIQQNSKKITFVEPARARNMIITMRRTNLSAGELKTAIDQFQIDKLSGECAELLMKYIPNKEELKKLAEHHLEYHNMGDAEKYLFQMTKVERLERKLSLLAFMGKFDDVVGIVKPEIDLIQRSSESLLQSLKLKKIFELILAFGNYMNSSKKGYALGFRLDTLEKLIKVKSRVDPQQTLLHFIVQYIEENYPELKDFADELDLCVEKGVSFQSVASDVLGLRKGMDLLRFEYEKQSDNEVLNKFFSKTSTEVVEVSDVFRKMEEVYKNTCAYFGEQHREIEPDELVRYVAEFVTAFKKASEENYKRLNPDRPNVIKTRRNATNTNGDTNSVTSRTSSETSSNRGLNKQPSRTPTNTGVNSNVNLNTPSKEKPSKIKYVTKVSTSDDLYDATGPPPTERKVKYDMTLREGENIIYHNIPVSNDSVYDQTAPSSGKGASKSQPNGHLEQTNGSYKSILRSSNVTKEGNIQLKSSNSFFYGAKGSEEPIYSKVRKSSSINVAGTSANTKQKTKVLNASTDPKMSVTRVDPKPTNGHITKPAEPLYESIPGDGPKHLTNGYVNGANSSATSSLSSTSLTSFGTNFGHQRDHHGSISGYLAPENVYSNIEDSRSESAFSRKDSRFFHQEFDDAIDTLNQVLDDAVSDVNVASEDESTSL